MEIDKKLLEKIRKRHRLLLILLHGSQVDAKTHPESDVDIAVVRKNTSHKLKLLKLMKDLARALNTDRVDLSDITHADPLLLYSTIKKSTLLAGNKKDYDALGRLAFHKYSDYLPFLEKEREFVRSKLKEYVTA